MPLSFEVLARDGGGRRGVLHTAHGDVATPAFMPVATLGAVKGLGPEELESLGADVMLANLYHLAVRPGIDHIERLGGIHRFTGWARPILTDSGGYQVFSLAELRKVDDDGVSFRSAHDGRAMRFTPESVVDQQQRLGVDVAMVLDECPPWPLSREQAADSLQRTTTWARRARVVQAGAAETALFGIVQGSFYPELRQRALSDLVPLDFDGYAIGGVSVGEAKTLGREVVRQVAPLLPEGKPRYLMGLGTPADIAAAVQQGVDLFDCVLPSRNARHGFLFTHGGGLRIKNARFRGDLAPVDEDCTCSTCRRVPRAFLHHLFRCGELSGKVLATVHNVRFYLDFMQRLRDALESRRLSEVAAQIARPYDSDTAGSVPESPAEAAGTT